MTSYAIVQASGKQFWVEENKFYDFDKLPLDKGDKFSINQILLVNQQSLVSVGTPYLDSEFSVEATVLRHLSGPKVRVYKMRPKKKTRKTASTLNAKTTPAFFKLKLKNWQVVVWLSGRDMVFCLDVLGGSSMGQW